MPLFDFLCRDCGKTSEILVLDSQMRVQCTSCGSTNLNKLLSAPSSLSGPSSHSMPGPGDTACCGSSPGHGNCEGQGSCCGRSV